MATAMVVDDSQIEALLAKKALEKLGYAVTVANSGEEALALLRQSPAELVLCDVSMPGMSGMDLLDASRHIEPHPIFIMSTSLDDARSAMESLRRGASGYLTKPLQEDDLNKSIQEAIGQRQKEQAIQRQLNKLAACDPLTGLAHRDEFLRHLSAHRSSPLHSSSPGALMMINVDGMHHINNTYGHQEGDRVLQHIGELLADSIEPADLVSRFAGNVFALFLVGATQETAEKIARHTMGWIEQQKIPISGKELSLTVSIGIAAYTTGLATEGLINNADFALHQAKQGGRNRLHLYHEEDEVSKQALSLQLIHLELVRQAIENQRFEMLYQPIVALKNGQVKHYEALVRFLDKDGNHLPPADLIKAAENFGLITRLDQLIVANCLMKSAELSRQGMRDIFISINLSGKSVGEDSMLRAIETAFEKSGADPSRIIFEITETAVFYNLNAVERFIRHIKALGCKFALDDFGVGFSSFYYIKQLAIDYLKIDGMFIKNLPDSGNDQVFVKAMVEISRVFGMQVIAEWVENAAIAETLKELGVDYAQGYHYGKPSVLNPESC